MVLDLLLIAWLHRLRRSPAKQGREGVEHFLERVDFVLYAGENGHITAAQKSVSAMKFSNTRLECSALSWAGCYIGPVTLTWYYRNSTLQNNTKYVIKEQIKDECKWRLLPAEFILEISNLTDEDVSEYVCQMYCEFDEIIAKDAIELLTVFQPGTKYYL